MFVCVYLCAVLVVSYPRPPFNPQKYIVSFPDPLSFLEGGLGMRLCTLLLGNSTTAAGKWGDYNCDMPYRTLENLMQFLSNRSDEVGFHSNQEAKGGHLHITHRSIFDHDQDGIKYST